MNDGEVTYFDLYISDKMVDKEQKKRTNHFLMPIILLSFHYLLYTPLYFLHILENEAKTDGDYDRALIIIAKFDELGKHAVLLVGLESLVLLMMVASIVRLVRNHNLYSLGVTALSLLVFVITRFIQQCIKGNTYILYEVVYNPVSVTNSVSLSALEITIWMSYLLCFLSMVPFLSFNRFYLMAFYCLVSVVTKCFLQIEWSKFAKFADCWSQLHNWDDHHKLS